MYWYIIILILVAYGIGEFVIGFFFNYKIFMIAKENFKIAATMGAISTIFYSMLIATSAFIAGTSLDGAYWFIAASATAMGIGNFFAALLVPVVSKKLKHFESDKDTKEINNEIIKEIEKENLGN